MVIGMASFQFRLEKVLTLREADRQQCRAELAEALQAERILESQDDEVNQELQIIRQSAQSAAGPGDINVSQLLDIHRYEMVLRTQLAEVVNRKELLIAEIGKRRERLVEADKQVRVLEKLRDRRLEAHLLKEQALETKIMDEIAQTQTQRIRR